MKILLLIKYLLYIIYFFIFNIIIIYIYKKEYLLYLKVYLLN